MFPLALGVGLDVYLISAVILDNSAAALIVALALVAVFAALWLWLPWRERGRV